MNVSQHIGRGSGLQGSRQISECKLETMLFGAPVPDLMRAEARAAIPRCAGVDEARQLIEIGIAQFNAKQKKSPEKKDSTMTVSLYSSTASGKEEIVVQTNALSLDLYISGLADALSDALDRMDVSRRPDLLASLFRNAFPVAFSIAGYKAEKVVESRMLVCGAAAPGESNLLAHSRT